MFYSNSNLPTENTKTHCHKDVGNIGNQWPVPPFFRGQAVEDGKRAQDARKLGALPVGTGGQALHPCCFFWIGTFRSQVGKCPIRRSAVRLVSIRARPAALCQGSEGLPSPFGK